MKDIFSRYLARLFLITFSLFAPAINAAIPADVNGEALPSLAPMLEKVTPAVVNIATEGRIQLRQSPLFADPLFRRFLHSDLSS